MSIYPNLSLIGPLTTEIYYRTGITRNTDSRHTDRQTHRLNLILSPYIGSSNFDVCSIFRFCSYSFDIQKAVTCTTYDACSFLKSILCDLFVLVTYKLQIGQTKYTLVFHHCDEQNNEVNEARLTKNSVLHCLFTFLHNVLHYILF